MYYYGFMGLGGEGLLKLIGLWVYKFMGLPMLMGVKAFQVGEDAPFTFNSLLGIGYL